jgi:hypothetical protein
MKFELKASVWSARACNLSAQPLTQSRSKSSVVGDLRPYDLHRLPIMSSFQVPTKIDLTPRRHHGYAVLLFIMGTLLPPLGL